MPHLLNGGRVPVMLWTEPHTVESAALDQLRNIARLPWVFHHVAVMPDVHYGKGATVGSVIAMKDAVSPAAVGVDIGCGMGAVRTNLTASDLPDSLAAIRSAIEAAIPVAHLGHDQRPALPPFLRGRIDELLGRYKDLDSQVRELPIEAKAHAQMGTLGGGNHFIELCLDNEDAVWLMLHSGSRNIGKTLAEVHIGRAKKLAHNADIPDPDLAVFLAHTPEMEAYRHDLFWAQEFARLNRLAMLSLYQGVLHQFFPQVGFEAPIACHHNYVAEEVHFGEHVFVTRKGAIHAGKGELGIIPGAMGAKSFIVEGLGEPFSYESASHGAGRVMSRGAAKRKFTVQDLERSTAGVECRKDEGVIDEIREAYKNIDEVIANQADLVKVRHELRGVLCVKG